MHLRPPRLGRAKVKVSNPAQIKTQACEMLSLDRQLQMLEKIGCRIRIEKLLGAPKIASQEARKNQSTK
jgi:hypothetical protein